MKYQDVFLEGFAHILPEEVVSSEQIESWLEPLYSRLRLPEGRLEMMTGIRERRFWPPGTPPSRISIETAGKLLDRVGLDRQRVGALIHGSVCRDFLEPATACGVHHGLGLSGGCMIYDVSNACLGLLNGMVQVANMIELGQIRAGVVVGTESSRSLVEDTIKLLNEDDSLSRNDIKTAVASLTIGSGSAAVLLTSGELSTTGNRLLGGIVRTNTDHCHLCQSDGMQTLMNTDSEALMREGIATAQAGFADFLECMDWQTTDIDKTLCHQVGSTHRRLTLEAFGLDPGVDYSTLEYLGNTGAVALPTAASIGIERGHVSPGDKVALLGIGSGINVVMLGVEWGQ